MQLNELKQIIRASVKQILSEKKNVLKLGDKPDPLHHLNQSKKITSSKKSNNITMSNEKGVKKSSSKKSDCGCGCNGTDCDDEKDKKSKVFHEKSDEHQHESLDDFDWDDFHGKKKSNDKQKSKNLKQEHSNSRWLNSLLEEDTSNMNDLDLNIDDDFEMKPNNKY